MTVVDPYDDSIERFVASTYRYDPERHERRNVVEIAFDNRPELLDFLRTHPRTDDPRGHGPRELRLEAGSGAQRRVERIAQKLVTARRRGDHVPAALSPTRLRVDVRTLELCGTVRVRYASRADACDSDPDAPDAAFPVLEAPVDLDGDEPDAAYGWVQMISRTEAANGPVTTCVARSGRAPAPLFCIGHRPTLSVAPTELGEGLWFAESFLVSVRERRLVAVAALSWGYHVADGRPRMLQAQQLPLHVWGTRRVQLAEHYPHWRYG